MEVINRVVIKISEYKMDLESVVIYALISFSFPSTYKYIIPLILGILSYQIYKVYSKKISLADLLNNLIYYLVFSLIFFRSIHTIILIITIVILFINKPLTKYKLDKKQLLYEMYVLMLFGVILLSFIVHNKTLKGIDTFLYLFLYPILFIRLKKYGYSLVITKIIKVFITSVLISLLYLIILNILFNNNLFITYTYNIYFADFIDTSHVYYGMFLGLSISFLLFLKSINQVYLTKWADYLIYVIFLFFIIYIGARMSLIAVFFVTMFSMYKMSKLKWYKKIGIIFLLAIAITVVAIKSLPRLKDGIESIAEIYTFVETNNNDNLINYSWTNMNQRYLVLSYSIRELKDNVVFGIGIKNVKDVISKKIIDDGYKYFEPLNTHNQYLHFFLGLGVFGFVYFLFMLYSHFLRVPQGTYFLLFFLIIMITESILVRVKGISLFFIFYLFFSYNRKVDLKL